MPIMMSSKLAFCHLWETSVVAKKKKGKALTVSLRLDPDVHRRSEAAARDLGISTNALFNIVIRNALPYWEMQAEMLKDDKTSKILREWFLYNPSRGIEQFAVDFLRLRGGLPILCTDYVWRALEGETLKPFSAHRGGDEPAASGEPEAGGERRAGRG